MLPRTPPLECIGCGEHFRTRAKFTRHLIERHKLSEDSAHGYARCAVATTRDIIREVRRELLQPDVKPYAMFPSYLSLALYAPGITARRVTIGFGGKGGSLAL